MRPSSHRSRPFISPLILSRERFSENKRDVLKRETQKEKGNPGQILLLSNRIEDAPETQTIPKVNIKTGGIFYNEGKKVCLLLRQTVQNQALPEKTE